FGNVPSGVADRFFDFIDRVAGGHGPAGVDAVEHGEVVVMISGSKNFVAGDAGETAEFAERGSLGIMRVAESEVNRVPLVVEIRFRGAGGVKKVNDVIHILLGLGEDADRAVI